MVVRSVLIRMVWWFIMPPTVEIANDGTECIDPMTDVNLTSTVAGGSNDYYYAWSGPNGFTSTEANTVIPNASSDQSGVYTLVVTDENGCTAESSTTLDITTFPNEPFVSATGPICEGEEITITAPVYAGYNVSYEWEGPTGTTSSGALPDAPSFTLQLAGAQTAGDFRVKVTVDGCESVWSEAYNLIVNETPQVNPTNNGVPCSATTNDLELIANPSGGTGNYTYQWIGPNGFVSNVENPVVPNVTADASGTYTLFIIDETGCQSAAASTVVDISNLPLTPVMALSDNQLCEGEVLELTTTPYIGTRCDLQLDYWKWHSDSNGCSIVIVIDSVEEVIHDGLYELSVTVDGCTSFASANANVSVTKTPTAPQMQDDDMNLCEGASLQLFTQTQAQVYHWTGPNGFTSSSQTPVVVDPVTPNHAGTYQLIVENNGCLSPASTMDLTVEALPAIPVIDTDLSICDGDTMVLSATAIPGYSYQWIAPSATPNSNFGTMGDPSNPLWTSSNTTAINLTDHPNLYEEGTWMVQAVSPNGCISQTALPADIAIHEIPSAPPALSNGPICEGEELLLLVQDMPGATYYWYEGDPVATPAGDLITTIQNPTLYNVAAGPT